MRNRTKNTIRQRGIVVVVLLAAVTVTARANASAFVNVDFNGTNTAYTFTPAGTYSGLGAAPNDAGTFWNGVGVGVQQANNPTFTSLALKQSDGTSTGIKVTVFGPFGTFDVQGNNNNPGISVAPALLSDFAYDPDNLAGSPVSFAITNLPASATFNLYFYSGGGGFGNATSVTIGTTTLASSGGPFASFNDATTDGVGNYVLFAGLTAPGGTISGTFTGSNSRFSGFELEIIPEPSTVWLAIAGGWMLWCKRRRGRT